MYILICSCKSQYNLSQNLKLVRKTSLRSFPTLVFPRVWNALTLESKRSESLSLFKKKILSDNPENLQFCLQYSKQLKCIEIVSMYNNTYIYIDVILNIFTILNTSIKGSQTIQYNIKPNTYTNIGSTELKRYRHPTELGNTRFNS